MNSIESREVDGDGIGPLGLRSVDVDIVCVILDAEDGGVIN